MPDASAHDQSVACGKIDTIMMAFDAYDSGQGHDQGRGWMLLQCLGTFIRGMIPGPPTMDAAKLEGRALQQQPPLDGFRTKRDGLQHMS